MDEQPPSPPPTPPPLIPPPSFAAPPPPPLRPPPVIYSAPGHPSGNNSLWKALAIIFLVLFCLSLFIHSLNFSRHIASRTHVAMENERPLEEVVLQPSTSDNKIAVVEVSGIIAGGDSDHTGMSLAESIDKQLKAAEHDNSVKAVILKVNSPGGEVLASDEINTEIRKFQDRSHKPVVVSMGTLAASGGYYISAPCRWIVANELTITGSIGVIMHGYNYRLLMDKIGIRPHVFKSGRFKDMLSGEQEPDTNKLSPQQVKNRDDEDAMVQTLIDQTYNKFKQVVKSGRDHAAEENKGEGHALASDWQDYADGRVLSGKQALDLGFVDELGDFDVAVSRAEKLTSISNATLVQYRMPVDFSSVLSHIFSKTDVPALKIDLGINLPTLEAGRMYFIAPTTVLN